VADEGTPGDVAASIVEMQALLLSTETIEDFLAELAGLAIRAVGEGLSCGITLQPNGRPLTVASTDALAARVDEVQYGLDEGPRLPALRTGTLVSIEDLASDHRWAAYAVFLVVAPDAHTRETMRMTGLDRSLLVFPTVADFNAWNGDPGTQPDGGGAFTCG